VIGVRGYWNGLFMGALVGAAAAAFYKNNQKRIKRSTRQVKARYKRAVDIINDAEEDLSALIGKQES